ncbi:hypothetical protein Clacol_003316 [Clathrus columnatus]|uniref:Integrase catalytic domain-containing protein n=1 Tax=Clathrus columnatus TaxID=1419009 RepID=A0AAV5A775_9AGAM|nr:hypothetical protein Clacol_003316 [Clathrus columnatus]
MSTSHNRNPEGRNGRQANYEVKDGEYWAPIIQTYLNQGVKLKDMLAKVQIDHNISMSKHSISRIIQKYELRTARLPCISVEEMKDAIVTITLEDDPLQEWGIRLILEELQMKSIHVPRCIIETVQRQQDPEEARHRWSGNRKIVRKTLFSSGPNEEWCMDGHKKLRDSMGIDVWGICDKYSQLELGLWAIPNACQSQVPVALFLRPVKEQEGVPLQLTGDKGSENGKVSLFQTALQTHFAPALLTEICPPVHLKELKNVLEAWRSGQQNIGYIHGNETHRELGTWLWAKLVQARLDRVRERQAHH